MLGIRRREFISLLGGTIAWPMASLAQQDDRARRIGVLTNGFENDHVQQARWATLREGLAKFGWIDGRNLRIDIRWGAGDPERLAAHATELVTFAPDVIVADAGAATRALQQATQTIPILYLDGGDPAVTGVVRNIARPEGNTTGFSNPEFPLAEKWLELLKEAAPHVDRAALLFNPAVLSDRTRPESVMKVAALAHGVATMEMPVHDPIEIERAIDAFAAEPNGGLLVFSLGETGPNRDATIRMALKRRLPAIFGSREDVAAGGLMSYGADVADQYRRSASYIDRLLHGAKVSELPVQFPTKFELVVNPKTAKAIGLTIPESLLLRVDEVIE